MALPPRIRTKASGSWTRIRLWSCVAERNNEDIERPLLQRRVRDSYSATRRKEPASVNSSRMCALDGIPGVLQNPSCGHMGLQAVRQLSRRSGGQRYSKDPRRSFAQSSTRSRSVCRRGPTAGFVRRRLIQWGRVNYARFPWRAEKDPFFVLVAEILLQRTRAEQVVPVWLRLKGDLPTPSAFANVSLSTLREAIRSLGLSWRASYLIELGRALTVSHGGTIPDDASALRSLPGVGDYVAGAFESFHRNRHATIIDSNVVRLYGRLFGFKTGPETRRSRKFIELAKSLTPRNAHRAFNYALLDFTRMICAPKPRCAECVLRETCSYYARSVRR